MLPSAALLLLTAITLAAAPLLARLVLSTRMTSGAGATAINRLAYAGSIVLLAIDALLLCLCAYGIVVTLGA